MKVMLRALILEPISKIWVGHGDAVVRLWRVLKDG